jgi:serine/threonine-protein kinase
VAAGAPAIDHRVDLYGLGCVAYWLLSGQSVFDEPHPTAMIVAHLQKEPTPPSVRAGIGIPADLDGLVLRLLAKDPDARPASAAELGELLRQCRDLAPWTPADAEGWWQAHAPSPPHAPSQPGVHATLHVAASRQ